MACHEVVVIGAFRRCAVPRRALDIWGPANVQKRNDRSHMGMLYREKDGISVSVHYFLRNRQ